MSAKKVTIGQKPSRKAAEKKATADNWVESRGVVEEQEKIKRLTIDIPESLHTRIKVKATMSGKTMADMIRDILQKNFKE